MKKRFLSFIVAGSLFLSAPLQAWGPLTHLAVNNKAYDNAVQSMGNLLCIPTDQKLDFIGGGPCPDIKFNAGDNFPYEFHNSLETVTRMIKLAKEDARFGLTDVIKALGYAGHLFSEVTTAHASEGYPNSKQTIIVKGGWVNHQVNELAMDILTYSDQERAMKDWTVSMPIRLLEASMKADQAKNSALKAMSAEQIKTAANGFLLTPVGVRTLAEYVVKTRPELIEEMDAFYSDRHDAFDLSVQEVTKMLQDLGRKDFGEKKLFTADKEDRVSLALSGTFGAKVKSVVLNLFSKSLSTGKANDIFTMISYGMLKGGMSSGLLRDRLKGVINSVYSGQIPGDNQHRTIVSRYMEGLLFREDLTYPEILAYAMEGFELDNANVTKQKTQFAKAGLKEGGRAAVDPEKLHAALDEVERLERLTRDWPIFWPLRPSVNDVAQAREKAGRMLAYYFIDHTVSGSLTAKAQQFLSADKALRAKMLEYKTQTYLNPIAKYNLWKDLSAASDQFRQTERVLGQSFDLIRAFGNNGPDSARLSGMIHDLSERVSTLQGSISRMEGEKKALPVWNLIERGKINEEIKKAQASIQELQEQLKAYQEMATAATAGSGSVTQGAAGQVQMSLEGQTLKGITEKYQRAYAEYTRLLGEKAADAPEVKKALETFKEAAALRTAAQQQGLK